MSHHAQTSWPVPQDDDARVLGHDNVYFARHVECKAATATVRSLLHMGASASYNYEHHRAGVDMVTNARRKGHEATSNHDQ